MTAEDKKNDFSVYFQDAPFPVGIELFSNILFSIPANVYWKDLQGRYLGCSYKLLEILKLVPQQLLGKADKDFKNFFENLVPDATSFVIANDNLVINNKCEYSFEEIGLNKDGGRATYLTRKAPLYDSNSGEVVGLIGVSVDISEANKKKIEVEEERKRFLDQYELADLYLQNIINALPVNIFWMDRDGRILGCNDMQANYMGLVSGQELIGKNIYDMGDILHWQEGVAEEIRKHDLEVMNGGQTQLFEEEIILNRKKHYFLTHKSPLKDKQGAVIGFLGSAVDITVRKELEEKLHQANEKLELANRIKDDFIANMEHDIRTPIVGVLGLANMLNEEERDPEKKKLLGYMQKSLQDFLNYCSEILDASSDLASNQGVQREIVDLRKLFETIISMEMPRVINEKIDLILDYAVEEPSLIWSDNKRLHRIIINLIGNALKFTDKGYVKVSVAFQQNDDARWYLFFSVEDTGIGIARADQGNVFEKFYRLEKSNRGKHKGTGLGLYIVKTFVEELGGKINLESEVGHGSKFACVIPVELVKAND
jgi:two-component system, OmpR family, aerobic respiration control sensor histidine kinase ArcB